MGILGTSSEEEAQLRQAAQAQAQNAAGNRESVSSLDASSFSTATDGYQTANDYTDNEAEAQSVISTHSTIKQQPAAAVTTTNAATAAANAGDETLQQPQARFSNPAPDLTEDDDDDEDNSVKQLDPPDDLDENELNRRYTIERIISHRSVEEVAEEEILREASRTDVILSDDEAVPISLLDWDGPDDSDNPHNWSKLKKWFITFTVAIVCLCVSLGSSLYVSGVEEISAKFSVSQELAISGLTFYLLGLALGPVLMAPLSEIIGRRLIYISTFPISMLFTMGIGLAKNIRTILILRFFCGYVASPALSIAGGTMTDIWGNSPADMSIAVALFCVAPFLGPVIGPIVGGFAAEHKGWEWTMWVSLMFSGAILPFLLICPETFKPVILKNRAIKRGIKVHRPPLSMAYVKTLLFMTSIKPIEMLVTEPIVSLLSLYIAFIFAVLFGFFEAFPIIFRGVYKMDLGVSGLPFIAVGLGLIFGVVFYIILDLTVFFKKNPDGTRGNFDDEGKIIWDPPESKLLVGKVGAVCLPIALFWMGWTGRTGSVHWMAPTAAGFPFGFGLILVFFAVVMYFSMSFPPINVASALAANNLLRYLLASVFPLFTVQMYQRLNIGWASSLFAFIALAMVPLPFVFGIWGPSFRARSNFGYAAYFKRIAAQKAAAAEAAAEKEPLVSATTNTSHTHNNTSINNDKESNFDAHSSNSQNQV